MTHRTNSSRTTRRPAAPPPPKATEQLTPGQVAGALPPRRLMDKIIWRAVGDLKPFPGNPRRHPEAQIAQLMRAIAEFWTNPILIDESDTILAGHARQEAAKRLGLAEVPTLTMTGLNAAEKRAAMIADNRLPEQAVWDSDVLQATGIPGRHAELGLTFAEVAAKRDIDLGDSIEPRSAEHCRAEER